MPVQRRRWWRAAFALAGVLVVGDAAQAVARYEPEPGTVVVRDHHSRSTVVRFLVPAGAAIGVREVAAAAAAAGIPNHELEERPADRRGVRELRLRTSLSDRTSLLSRRIDSERLRRLDVFGEDKLALELHPWATVVAGDVRPLGADLLFRRYAVTGEADLAYRIPTSALLRPLLVIVLLTLVPYVGLRAYVARVAGSAGEATDKVHRLRGAMLAVTVVLPLALVAGLFLGGLFLLPDLLLAELAPGLAPSPAVPAVITVLLYLLLALVAVVPATRAVGREYRALRGISPARASRAGNARLGLALGLPLLLWLPLAGLPLASGLPEGVRVALQVSWLLVMLATMPLLAVRLLPTRPLEEPQRSQLDILVERSGVRIRELRVLDTRDQKVANALVIGPVPRLRYVLVTDYLLETLEQDELEAVVAHELGHARQHHVLVKLGALLLLVAAAVGVGVALVPLIRDTGPIVPVLAIPVLVVAALLLVQGALGLLLERKADDYAARLAGADPMIRALERLAEANLLKRRTGPLWNLLTHHPGISERVERLRARPPAPTAG